MEHPFRDTVVTNLVKLVDVLPKLNVTGDPELERLAAQVRASLLVDPQELRKSESVRSETAKDATAICERMAGVYGWLFGALLLLLILLRLRTMKGGRRNHASSSHHHQTRAQKLQPAGYASSLGNHFSAR